MYIPERVATRVLCAVRVSRTSRSLPSWTYCRGGCTDELCCVTTWCRECLSPLQLPSHVLSARISPRSITNATQRSYCVHLLSHYTTHHTLGSPRPVQGWSVRVFITEYRSSCLHAVYPHDDLCAPPPPPISTKHPRRRDGEELQCNSLPKISCKPYLGRSIRAVTNFKDTFILNFSSIRILHNSNNAETIINEGIQKFYNKNKVVYFFFTCNEFIDFSKSIWTFYFFSRFWKKKNNFRKWMKNLKFCIRFWNKTPHLTQEFSRLRRCTKNCIFKIVRKFGFFLRLQTKPSFAYRYYEQQKWPLIATVPKIVTLGCKVFY